MVNSRSLDTVYSALADATRRGMVERLQQRPHSVSELAEPLSMTLAAVGKHIAVLEAAHIITTTKQGRVRHCALVPDALAEATSWITDPASFWNSRLDALVSYLEEEE